MWKIGFRVKDASYSLQRQCHWCTCVLKMLLSHLYTNIHFGLSLNALVIPTATHNCSLKLNLGLMSVLPYCNMGQSILKMTCKWSDAALFHESKYTKLRFPWCYPTSTINPLHKLKATLSFSLLNFLLRISAWSLVHGIRWIFFTLTS